MSTSTDFLAAPLADPDTFADGPPLELFTTLRDSEPVAWTPEPEPQSGFWSVTRHADIVTVTRDEELFSSELGGANLEELDQEQIDMRKSMLETDGARHWALRRLLQHQFTPRGLVGYEEFLRGLTASTLDAAFAKGEFDFVKEVSADFPIRVLARMLDVPDEDTGQLIDWGNKMVGNSDPDYTDVLADSEESEKYRLFPFRSPAALEVFEYGFDLAAKRKGSEGNDLVSRLVNQTPEDGVPMDDRDFRNYFLLLIIAGNETTRQSMVSKLPMAASVGSRFGAKAAQNREREVQQRQNQDGQRQDQRDEGRQEVILGGDVWVNLTGNREGRDRHQHAE